MPRKVMRNEELRAGHPHPIYINVACGIKGGTALCALKFCMMNMNYEKTLHLRHYFSSI